MTEFLIRHFVKDYERVQDVEVRTRYGALAGMVGICCNLILFAAKLIAALMGKNIRSIRRTLSSLPKATEQRVCR